MTIKTLDSLLDCIINRNAKEITSEELRATYGFNSYNINEFIEYGFLTRKERGIYNFSEKNLYNYAKSLRKCGELDKAVLVLLKCYQINPIDSTLYQIFKIYVLKNDIKNATQIFSILYPPEFFEDKEISLPFLYMYLINNLEPLPDDYNIFLNILYNQDSFLNDYMEDIVSLCVSEEYDGALIKIDKLARKKGNKSKFSVLKNLVKLNILKKQEKGNLSNECAMSTSPEETLYSEELIEKATLVAKKYNISDLDVILKFQMQTKTNLEIACLYRGLDAYQINLVKLILAMSCYNIGNFSLGHEFYMCVISSVYTNELIESLIDDININLINKRTRKLNLKQ